MNAVGTWKVTLSIPMGPQAMQLVVVAVQGGGFTGRIESALGDLDVAGTVDGDRLSWVMDVTQPMPIKITFDVAVEGDALRGVAVLGGFGEAGVSGERLSEVIATGASAAPAGPMQVTGDSVDPQYDEPYIEIDEQRSEPAPHRYVRGGFKGTDARFSFYFPAKEGYQGRFFHNTYPMATTSDVGPFPIAFDVSTGDLGFTFDSGAYYVQTNLGGADRAGGMADPAIAAYRVNAAAAKFSRKLAAQMYGEHRPYGYLFGGSGGSYQVVGSAENTTGVWDGFVPFVLGSPHAIPSMFTVRMHALRVLRKGGKFAGVMDAIDPGGSGAPYAGLNEEEAGALREASLMGYPLRGWWDHETLNSGHFMQVAPIMPLLDASYVEDFWSKPGYLGGDAAASVRAERFQFDTTVARVIEGYPKKIELEQSPAQDAGDSHLVILSGAAAGKSVPIAYAEGAMLSFAFGADQGAINSLQPGDRVRVDNSWALALQTYHRHQVPSEPDLYGWNQFRDADGQPIHPQRGVLIGPIGAANTAGCVPNGKIHGKVLVVEALMDIDALPWQADWYRSRVKAELGPAFEDSFAIWFVDHAQHDNPQSPAGHARTVSYAGALQQALRDVAAWVEKGERPADTRYSVVDTQVQVPASAAERGGVQPVVALQANGAERAEVAVGEAVTFTATIETPPGAGAVVAAQWDFEGVGDYPVAAEIGARQPKVSLSATHAYPKAGTYFAVLRAASQRQGDPKTPYGRVQNLARVRVVVR